MLGRRQIDTNPINGSVAPLRSSLGDVAWAVEERLVWGSADALRGVGSAVRWPFQQLAWAVERLLVWPLQERTDYWSTPLRVAAAGAVGVVAAGAVAAGVLLAKSAGEERPAAIVSQAATLIPPPAPAAAPQKAATAVPTLRGVAPDFTAEADGGVAAKSAAATSQPAASSAAATEAPAEATASKAATDTTAPAGPAAIKVAHAFADAFVLYETGKAKEATVRAALAQTAAPRLVHSLLKRPPRLPANVNVPKAKVLNVVPGPSSGDTYTFSISLLRVGVTSELRIDMQRDEQGGKWQVTDVLG